MLPTHPRLSCPFLAGLADPQAEGDEAWPGGTAAGGSCGRVERPSGEPATAVAAAMAQYPVVDPGEELDTAAAQDDAQGDPASCGAGDGSRPAAGRGCGHGLGDPRTGRRAAKGDPRRRVGDAGPGCGDGASAGR